MIDIFTSLRARLIISYLLLIIFGFGTLALIAGDEIETGLREAYSGNLTTQSALVLRALQNQSLDKNAERQNLGETLLIIKKLSEELEINITLLDPRGVAWLDSTYGFVDVDLSDEQEVKSAIDGKYVPEQYDKDLFDMENALLQIATPLTVDGAVAGYLRLGQPVIKLQDDINERWGALLMGVSTLSLIAIGISIWNANALSRPLRQLRDTATLLSAGDLTQRSSITRPAEIGDLARTFNKMAASVESMVTEQRAFAANTSHELRTPLTTIQLRTEWLLSKELDEETESKYLTEIDSEVKRLGRLLEDLQMLSRADADRLEAGNEEVDPKRVAMAVLREFSPMAQARQITLKLDAASEFPIIRTNTNHIQIVFRNLLENAIKYTPAEGAVTWKLFHKEPESHSSNGPEPLLISQIEDSGIGLNPDEIPNLTSRFYRVDKSHSRRVSGSGLGLSLVQSIIRLYNGELQIESEGLGKGTTVTVAWPIVSSRT